MSSQDRVNLTSQTKLSRAVAENSSKPNLAESSEHSSGKSAGKSDRRQFLRNSAAVVALSSMTPYWSTPTAAAANLPATSKNDRPVFGCIGVGSRWTQLRSSIQRFSDVVAVCDVDTHYADRARKLTGGRADIYEDYRHLLDRTDINAVSIATPDHWHTKIAIEAMQSGKDVYCEKPVTLTIEEGKLLCQVAKKTGRILQVGTQQRTTYNQGFLRAIALVRAGRLGKIKHVECRLGGAPTSGPLPVVDPPKHLNWEKWLGQAPLVDYVASATAGGRAKSRCHYEFRWWLEYSGGKLTDWGAHNVDIGQWGIGMHETGPSEIEYVSAKLPVPFEKGYPTVDNQYNTPTEFMVRCKFPNDITMTIRHDQDNGVLFEGTKGRIFVNRGKLVGQPVEELKTNPLPEDAIRQVYKGKDPTSHMGNFFDCVKTRDEPISDIFSHHRTLTTCHLTNIAIRLGRSLKWDPVAEQILGDEEAKSFQSRTQRAGYEIKV